MQIFKCLFLMIITVFIVFSCAKSKHKIGSMYKGGYVFKINMFGHGYCAAPKDLKPMEWGCYGTLINGADGEKVGTGKQNTKDIVGGCTSIFPYAAKACDDLVIDSYEDWYLPSVEELLLMHRELYSQSLGALTASEYWSSTQNYSLGAWKVDFASGEKGNNSNKANKGIRVRAIRSF